MCGPSTRVPPSTVAFLATAVLPLLPSPQDGDEEAVEIEYVSAPLDIDFLGDAAAAAAAGGGGGDTEMGEGGGLGLGLGAQPAAGAEGGEQPPADPAAELQRILQRFGTVEELMGRETEEGEEGEEGGAGGSCWGGRSGFGWRCRQRRPRTLQQQRRVSFNVAACTSMQQGALVRLHALCRADC